MRQILSTILCCLFLVSLSAQEWTQVSSMPDDFRSHHSFGFGINDIGYIVTGTEYQTDVRTKSFYSYDPVTDTWTQKDDFPGAARSFGIGEVYNGKAYFGFGLGSAAFNDLWVYDPVTDVWEELPSCPCDPRWHPAFTITNDKIIVGMGGSQTGNRNDFWMYDILTEEWTQIATYPGVVRHHPYQFSIGDYHYAGFGHGQAIYSDWNRYDSVTDTWEAMANIPGESRVAGTQFAFNGKGYALSGDGADHRSMETGEFWEYDPATDSWLELPPHPGTSRWAPASFILNNAVYIVNGLTEVPDLGYVEVDEVYKYQLAPVSNTTEIELTYDIYPNPASTFIQVNTRINFQADDKIEIRDITGKLVTSMPAQSQVNIEGLPVGTYTFTLKTKEASMTKKFVKI
jgi:N-acetylneuraminic acid mutarotase